MKRPNFQPIFDSKKDFCEKSSSEPISSFIPHQALDLATLMKRFEQGQRLNIHENFKPMSNFTQDKIYEESFDDAPPIVHDICEVQEAMNEHNAHKKDYEARKKKAKADDAKRKQAEEAKPKTAPAPTE